MKKICTLFIGIVFSMTILNAQDAPPQAFSFKATIKDNKNNEIVLKTISLRISILRASSSGNTVYSESFRPTTNLYSQVDVEIGHGSVISGIFSAIEWADDIYFLKVEVDTKGGTNYQTMSISQLLSVPYALYSGAAANSFSGNFSDLIGAPNLALVATTGSYFDLSDRPLLFSGFYNDLKDIPVFFSGNYNDLTNQPTLFDGTWSSLTGKPDFKTIAISGSWEDLINTPVTLSGYGIKDAMSVSHAAYAISADNISNWNSAAGWGNHADLYRPVSYVPTWSDIIENPFLITSPLANQLLRFNSVTGKWENWIPDFLIAEVDGSVTNEIQTLSISGHTITLTDGGTINLPVITGLFYYSDRDNDGYGDAFSPVWVPSGVEPPAHFIPQNTDCNDTNPSINPGATETQDDLDNNCDGLIDNYQCSQFSSFPTVHSGEFSATLNQICLNLPGIPSAGQCTINVQVGSDGPWIYIDAYAGNTLVASDDHLLVFEVEQGVEYKVNLRNTPYNDVLNFGPFTVGISFNETIDMDNDGYSVAGGDCNDHDTNIHPGAIENCDDGIDNNCDGITDGGGGNNPPVADANGPYVITEQENLWLSGTMSDIDQKCNPLEALTAVWDLYGNNLTPYLSGIQRLVPWTGVLDKFTTRNQPINIKLVVTDITGRTAESVTQLTIYDRDFMPCFAVSPSTTAGCSETLAFDASCTSHPDPRRTFVTYEWDFENATYYSPSTDPNAFAFNPTSVGKNQTHVYSTPGTYRPTLRVQDDAGFKMLAQLEVTIVAKSEICDGLDNDCDGEVDEGCATNDADGDGVPDTLDPDLSDPDSDNDGLNDGIEDANHNGVKDPAETNALDADTDDDGISDGEESIFSTMSLDADTDDDGLNDGLEIGLRGLGISGGSSISGVAYVGTHPSWGGGDTDPSTQTNPLVADTDADGVMDGMEDRDHDGAMDATETNPLDADTDDDGLTDAVEDKDHDGVLDALETNPLDADTDDDGLVDGVEDMNKNGSKDPNETDPRDADSDNDSDIDGIDCRPLDAVISHLAAEICGDGTDNDCDGKDPKCPENLIRNSSFEEGPGNLWNATGVTYTTSNPHDGNYSALFAQAYCDIRQVITIPAGAISLKFNFWELNTTFTSGVLSYLAIYIDGQSICNINPTAHNYWLSFSYDIPLSFSDGGTHTLSIESSNPTITPYYVDAVELIITY